MRRMTARPAIVRGSCAVFAFTLLISACGSAEEPAGNTVSASAQEEEEERQDYRVILSGAAIDTLSGSAVYGFVVNPETDSVRFVVKLTTGVDFVGGVFIARGNDQMPEERSYSLANNAEVPDSSLGSAFAVAYQEGLLRQLTSREGSVTFSHVSDTLVSGTLDATLRGRVATGRGGEVRDGEIHVSGRFDARKGIVGFVVGI